MMKDKVMNILLIGLLLFCLMGVAYASDLNEAQLMGEDNFGNLNGDDSLSLSDSDIMDDSIDDVNLNQENNVLDESIYDDVNLNQESSVLGESLSDDGGIDEEDSHVIYVGRNITENGEGTYENPFSTLSQASANTSGEDKVIVNLFNGTYDLGSVLKFNTSNFTQKIDEELKENLKQTKEENLNNKSILSEIKNEIDKKMKEFEELFQKNKEEKTQKMTEIEERINLIEKNNITQFQNYQKGNLTNLNELNNIKNLIKNNNIIINDEINLIKKDMTFVKNELQNLKGAKVNMNSDLNKIIKEIEYINQNFEKALTDINNTKLEIQTKINNYESTNRLFNQNFSDMREELLNHLDEINNINREEILRIKDETFGQIKQIKNDMNQFNLNIIKENQKFIDYNQSQLKEHDNNLKQLFEYTSDDIEVLKKKSDTLESLLKNTRNEMLNNINSVEGFLTNRYDSILKSISSERNINKF